MKSNVTRWLIGAACVIGLIGIYLFQSFDLAGWLGLTSANSKFIFAKAFRFLVNDFLMIGLLYALFFERKYVIFALWVQLIGFIFILLPYFALKLIFHTGNGPLVSFLHRLVLNPTLMILLIPAFYYQKKSGK